MTDVDIDLMKGRDEMSFKWGVIGTGRIARTFCEALGGVPEAESFMLLLQGQRRKALLLQSNSDLKKTLAAIRNWQRTRI